MQVYTKIVRIRHCNKLFDIFCDKNHKKYFLQVVIKDGKEHYYYPELCDYVNLNLIYNASEKILYFKKYNFSKMSAAIVIAGIGTYLLIGLDIPKIENFVNSKYYLQKNDQNLDFSDVILEEEYPNYLKIGNTIYLYHNDALTQFGYSPVTFDELKDTLKNNYKITGKYRDYTNKFINALEERLPNIDLRIINYNLNKLEFEVISNEDWERQDIDGCYDSVSNKIYVRESYNSVFREEVVVFHELCHVLNNSHMTYVEPNTSRQYSLIKHFYGTNAYGNSFSEGMNSILTDYLLYYNWQTYFEASAHRFDSYNDIASLEYQLLLLDDSYNLYDYLNGNVNYLENHLKQLDLDEMIDVLDIFLNAGDNITVEDRNSLDQLERKIVNKKVLQQLSLGKSDLEIYKSFIGLFLTCNDTYELCNEVLDEQNQDWTIRIQKVTEKNKTITIDEKGESKEVSFTTLVPEICIYSSDKILCTTTLDSVLIYSTFDDDQNIYHFGKIDYQNDVLYDILTNQVVEKENLREMAQLSSILENFTKYDIDLNIDILNSNYFHQEIEKRISSNEEEYDSTNIITK